MTEILSPLPTPIAWRAFASRFARSCISAKVRDRSSQTIAVRSGTTDEAIIRNSAVFMGGPPAGQGTMEHREQ